MKQSRLHSQWMMIMSFNKNCLNSKNNNMNMKTKYIIYNKQLKKDKNITLGINKTDKK